jgi:predicted Zn-dependent protease
MDDRARLVAALEQAREGGAKAAEVLRCRRQILEQGGSRQAPALRDELKWTVRVWRDGGRAGVAEGPLVSDAVTRALATADEAPPNPVAGPADRMPIRTGAQGIDDPRHRNIADEDRVEILQHAERAFANGPVRLRALRYRQCREERAWMSTRGVEAAEGSTRYEVSATAVLGDQEAQHRIASRHFSDVASLPFGPELRRRVEPFNRALPAPAQPLPLILEPRVMADLVRALAPAFAAGGASSFITSLAGKRLAPTVLHLTDDAGLFGGLRTRGFDDRGVPPIAVTLLKEGTVHGFFHDPESARAVGLRPTGHVEGKLLPSNLIVRPGSRTRNVILGELGTYFLLDRLPPLNLATGGFEARAPAVLVERGERIGVVSIGFRGSLGTFLGGLREVAADQERSSEVDTPTGVFERVRAGE